jgi:hypothetical protein
MSVSAPVTLTQAGDIEVRCATSFTGIQVFNGSLIAIPVSAIVTQ